MMGDDEISVNQAGFERWPVERGDDDELVDVGREYLKLRSFATDLTHEHRAPFSNRMDDTFFNIFVSIDQDDLDFVSDSDLDLLAGASRSFEEPTAQVTLVDGISNTNGDNFSQNSEDGSNECCSGLDHSRCDSTLEHAIFVTNILSTQRVSKPPLIFFSCGEASGDLYVSELLSELSRRSPGLKSFGLGGMRCAAAGGELVVSLDEVSVMGLVEVVSKLPGLRRAMGRLCAAAERRRPDAAVLVDFSGFNLRLAKRLEALGIPILYYVSPQVWAWRRGRIRTIRNVVDEMLVIFPFEETFYRENGVEAHYVGHPLVDLVRAERNREQLCRDLDLDAKRTIVAMLPGSRRSEIERHVPVLREAIVELKRQRPGLQFIVSRASTITPALLTDTLGDANESVRIVGESTYDILSHATVAVVASGTAVVEAALSETPVVVIYRVGWASYLMGKPFVNLPHYSMVNLIAGRSLVPELIQGDMTASAVVSQVFRLIDDAAYREDMVKGLRDVKTKLGLGGASGRAADAVLTFLSQRSRDGAQGKLL